MGTGSGSCTRMPRPWHTVLEVVLYGVIEYWYQERKRSVLPWASILARTDPDQGKGRDGS